MNKILLFFLFIFISTGYIFSQEYIFEFKIDKKTNIQKISKIISIDDVYGNKIKAYANKQEFKEFKKLGYDYKLLPHPASGKSLTMATTVAEMANWDRYPTYDVFIDMMNQFADDYPDLCRIENIGTSVEGRDVLVAKITDNPDIDEQEPEFYYTGQMHGDEIVTYILLLRLIDYLLSNYQTNDRVANLINNFEIWINPLSNPDGTYASGNNTVSGATRYNANSVDLNRNFPSPNDPNPAYQNEPEVQMQINFAQEHNFVISSNFHSGAELVNYPWDSWTSDVKTHADHNWFDHISHNYADTVHQYSPSSYMSGYDNGVTHGGDWYVVDGSRQDHMCYYQNCREVTLELSAQKMLDCEDLPDHWFYNRSALLGYIEECLYGFNGTVTNTNSEPLDAKIEIISHDFDNSEVYTDSVIGDYYRPIEPGTYQVTFSADGYIAQNHIITIDDWETTVVKDVVLEQAQQVNLSGIVIDAQNSEFIENVEISFPETSISPVSTNSNGEYSCSILENIYEISVYKNGYSLINGTYTITAQNNILDFALIQSDAITFENEIPPEISLSGNADWFRTNLDSYEGDYSIQSGNIDDDQISVMTLSKSTQEGSISFYKKVSCEDSYSDDWDFLKFEIDGVEKGRWDGEVDWSNETFAVTEGNHNFVWTYSKDGSVSSGSDCAWVDYIELPSNLDLFQVTFSVTANANPVENAIVRFPGYSQKNTDPNGQCVFYDVYQNNIGLNYYVFADGYYDYQGSLTVNSDFTEYVNLTPVSNKENETKKLDIYPNPADDFINIKTKDNSKIFIYNLNGKKLLDTKINSSNSSIDLSQFKNGIYIFKMISENDIFIEKIIIK